MCIFYSIFLPSQYLALGGKAFAYSKRDVNCCFLVTDALAGWLVA